jgi:hypothetical protein
MSRSVLAAAFAVALVGAEIGVVSRQFRGAEVGFGVAVEYLLSSCYRGCIRLHGTTRVRMFPF